jgi:hypothetical protein
MKFLVPNYSCLQNPRLGATAPRSPFSLSSVLNWICWTTPPTKFLGAPLLLNKSIAFQMTNFHSMFIVNSSEKHFKEISVLLQMAVPSNTNVCYTETYLTSSSCDKCGMSRSFVVYPQSADVSFWHYFLVNTLQGRMLSPARPLGYTAHI